MRMTLACVLLHIQIKELEDGLAAGSQSSAHLQSQLDAASAAAQSQATELTTSQAQVSQLRAESESLQSQLSEAQRDWQAAKDTCETQEAAATHQAQQWTVKASAVVCTHGQFVVQVCLFSNSSKQQLCCSHLLPGESGSRAYAEHHAVKLLYSRQASLFLAWVKETCNKYYVSMPYILWLCVCLSAWCV